MRHLRINTFLQKLQIQLVHNLTAGKHQREKGNIWTLTLAIWAWTPLDLRAVTAFCAAAGLSKSTKPYPVTQTQREFTVSKLISIFTDMCSVAWCWKRNNQTYKNKPLVVHVCIESISISCRISKLNVILFFISFLNHLPSIINSSQVTIWPNKYYICESAQTYLFKFCCC